MSSNILVNSIKCLQNQPRHFSDRIRFYIFIGLVIFNFLLTTLLDYINDKNWKDKIPDGLKDFYDAENYRNLGNLLFPSDMVSNFAILRAISF